MENELFQSRNEQIQLNIGEQYQWSSDERWKESTIRNRDIRKENIKILPTSF